MGIGLRWGRGYVSNYVKKFRVYPESKEYMMDSQQLAFVLEKPAAK